MYRQLFRRLQIPPVAVKKHFWTQGDGPNYQSNVIVVSVGTVICAVIGTAYAKWKFDKGLDAEES